MSRFMHTRFSALAPYVPGEQPKGRKLIKLNTNESPFPPPESLVERVRAAAAGTNLYCDPDCAVLRDMAAKVFGVTNDMVLCCNGSDEALSFAFMAFGEDGAAFPDISYGFYPVFAAVHGVDALAVGLKDDLTVDPKDYEGVGRLVVIANPNAPTGLMLSGQAIESIVMSNPHHVVVVDEAYVDFGAESVMPLTKIYPNLVVTRTFSKSHSLAGARIGFAVADRALIADMNALRNATNPYNVSAMAQAAGIAAFEQQETFMQRCRIVTENRERTARALRQMGFYVTGSMANFLFARHERIAGETLYRALRERDVLVRWFNQARIRDFVRISVGDKEQMDALIAAISAILEEKR